MRVRAKSDWKEILAQASKSSPLFVSAGTQYTVYGLSWPATSLFDPGCVCKIIDDGGNLVSAPLAVFEIVDDQVSANWRVREGADGSIFVWPEAFYREFFFDDLSEGVAEVAHTFKAAKAAIDAEQG